MRARHARRGRSVPAPSGCRPNRAPTIAPPRGGARIRRRNYGGIGGESERDREEKIELGANSATPRPLRASPHFYVFSSRFFPSLSPAASDASTTLSGRLTRSFSRFPWCLRKEALLVRGARGILLFSTHTLHTRARYIHLYSGDRLQIF